MERESDPLQCIIFKWMLQEFTLKTNQEVMCKSQMPLFTWFLVIDF